MDQKTFEILLNSLLAPLRVALMALFILLAKMGWFTWLTPETYANQVNAIMDFLVVAAPSGYVIWVGITSFKKKVAEAKAAEPVEMVRAAAALTQVGKIVTTPEIAEAIRDPSVVSAPMSQPIN